MTNLRDLSPIKTRAALEAHRELALAEVQELPLATAQNRKYMMPLVCQRTGLVVATVATISIAGHVPLLGQWKNTQVLHPFFSLTPVALLQFGRNSWLRFCALTHEETNDSKVVAAQEEQLRIIALAMLHNLTEVRQDIHWMPEWKDVARNWTALMSIGYWYAYLDSHRFRFPTLRLSKLERDIDLHAFLQSCFAAKKRYEKGVNDKVEEEKLKIAEKAMKNGYDAIAKGKPRSIKILWSWFVANMPVRYKKDLAGWMWDLFSATDQDIFEFTVRDIELFEDIFLTECPTGSTISHAFLEVLRGKHQLLSQHFHTYEILIPESIAEGVASGAINVAEEPRLADYPSRVKWFKAHCQWQLAQPTARKHQEAERARQQTETVTPSFRPKLVIGAAADELEELEANELNDYELQGNSDDY